MRDAIDCGRVREGLREYLDGARPPADGEALERHLEACEACRSALRDLADAGPVPVIAPRPPMPEGMKSALLSAFRDRS